MQHGGTFTSGQAHYADVNGDGLPDLIFQGNDNRFYVSLKSGQFPDIATVITNGLGSATSITYKPLTDLSVYTKEATAVYPVQDIQNPMYVAASVSSSNGIGGLHTANYSYSGAKTHLTGGGFLGFRQMTVSDAQTGIASSATYRQDYPYQGLPAGAQKVTASGALLNQTSNTWTFATNATWSAQYHVPLLTQSNATAYELASNGAAQGAVVTQSTTCKTYDAYANATYVGVWSTNVASCASPPAKTGLFVNETSNTYLNDTTNWFLGRLTGSTVTNTTP